MAHSKGCANVVATLGTSFTNGHGRILRRYAKKVVLIYDSDTAGIEAANRALDVCLSQRIDIKFASVPEGKDPCDFLLTTGKGPFEQLVDEATDVLQFKWDRLLEGFGSDETLAGKRAAIEEFLQTIATGISAGNLPAIDRGLIINRLSKIIGLDGKEIRAELRKALTRAARAASYDAKNQKAEPAVLARGLSATAQREILEVLLNKPKLFEIVKQRIKPELFDAPILRQIADVLFETFETDSEASLTAVLARTESVEVGKFIVELAQAGEEKGNFQSRLTGALDTIQRIQEQRKKNRLKEIEDPTRFLRSFSENIAKENPHNIGMV